MAKTDDKTTALLLHVSRQMLDVRKSEELFNAVWGYYKTAVDIGLAASLSIYAYAMYLTVSILWKAPLTFMGPYAAIGCIAAITAPLALGKAYHEIYWANSALNKYSVFNGSNDIDSTKLSNEDKLKFSIGSFAKTYKDTSDDAEELKKIYIKNILNSYKLEGNDTGFNKDKACINLYPYSDEYINKQKDSAYYNMWYSGASAGLSFLVAGGIANYAYNVITIGASFALFYYDPMFYMVLVSPKLLGLTSSLFFLNLTVDSLITMYNNYEKMNFYSSLETENKETADSKISYQDQDIVNRVLYNMFDGDKTKIKEVATSFRDMVSMERSAALVI